MVITKMRFAGASGGARPSSLRLGSPRRKPAAAAGFLLSRQPAAIEPRYLRKLDLSNLKVTPHNVPAPTDGEASSRAMPSYPVHDPAERVSRPPVRSGDCILGRCGWSPRMPSYAAGVTGPRPAPREQPLPGPAAGPAPELEPRPPGDRRPAARTLWRNSRSRTEPADWPDCSGRP
jgi:hypothetical protein